MPITSSEVSVENLVHNMPKHITSILVKSGEMETVNLYDRIIQLGERGFEITNVAFTDLNLESNTVVALSQTSEYKQRFSSTFDFDSVISIEKEILS